MLAPAAPIVTNVTMALGSMLGITALDVINARQPANANSRPWSNEIDFRTRSGLPGGQAAERQPQPAEAM